jgi:hypothetical protein
VILGFLTPPIKILACIHIDRYKKIGTICIKDTCLRIHLVAARGLRSRYLGNSLAARSLRDDRLAGNKQENINKKSRVENSG